MNVKLLIPSRIAMPVRRSSRHQSSAAQERAGISPGQQTKAEAAPAQRPGRQTVASKIKKRMLEEEQAFAAADSARKRTKTKAAVEPEGVKVLSQMCDMSRQRGVTCTVPGTSRMFEHLRLSPCLPHYLYSSRLGIDSALNRKSVVGPVVRRLKDLGLFRVASPFDRRVTALEWHPTSPGMVIAGSKGGDLMLWNSLKQNINDHFIQGIGAGGSIQAVKVWPWDSEAVLTASIDGRVVVRQWSQQTHTQVLTDTFNCLDYWYCCVDVSASRKAVVTGDNVGNTLLLSTEGQTLWRHRLHKQKVTHAEFSPRDDWLFITASTDTTVKVWDLRKVSGPKSSLAVLKHDKPVNSAYFSRTDGCRLLTTDQYSEVRVYQTSAWHLETSIQHPHRFFQHITPIKATWHPLQDLVVVGRYPSKDFPGYIEGEPRTIDIIDASTGHIVCQLNDPSAPGIVSLNKFSDSGDYLVSGMGVNMLLWGASHDVEERRLAMMENYQYNDLDPLRSNRRSGVGGQGQSTRRRPPSSSSSSSEKKKVKETELKVKVMKTPTKAKNQKR